MGSLDPVDIGRNLHCVDADYCCSVGQCHHSLFPLQVLNDDIWQDLQYTSINIRSIEVRGHVCALISSL